MNEKERFRKQTRMFYMSLIALTVALLSFCARTVVHDPFGSAIAVTLGVVAIIVGGYAIIATARLNRA